MPRNGGSSIEASLKATAVNEISIPLVGVAGYSNSDICKYEKHLQLRIHCPARKTGDPSGGLRRVGYLDNP